MVKGGVCEDNDMCDGRWNAPERHVVGGRLVGVWKQDGGVWYVFM